jgi:biopolymer transport protein ExbB/TolQ
MYRTVMAGAVVAVFAAVSGLVVTSFTSHATDVQVRAVDVKADKIEKEAKERDAKLEKKLDEHQKEAQKEWRAQAAFRAALAEKLKVTLPPEG